MPSKLCKWGNSLGVRLPQYVVERTGVRPGDYLFIRLSDAGDIVIRACKARDVHSGYLPSDSPRRPRPVEEEKW
jgi:antitoxin MazE